MLPHIESIPSLHGESRIVKGSTHSLVHYRVDIAVAIYAGYRYATQAAPSAFWSRLPRYVLRKPSRAGRGDRREKSFLDDVDRQDFIKTLAEACQKTSLAP